jgi:hypothetical protein
MPKALPMFALIPQPLDEQAKRTPPFEGGPPDLGKRHRIGGKPEFIQRDRWPRCPACGNEMTFYGQLDAVSPEFEIADTGLIYVFLCFDDFEAVAFVQSY